MLNKIRPLSVPVNVACNLTGLGRTTIYRLLGEGALESVAVGRRRLVLVASIDRLISGQARAA
jgi:excisionase family DNA binding protein